MILSPGILRDFLGHQFYRLINPKLANNEVKQNQILRNKTFITNNETHLYFKKHDNSDPIYAPLCL